MTADTSEQRKATPLYSGCMAYFPDALAAVAKLSKIGNDKHNPGQPMHWSREKSTDHADCLARHLVAKGQTDPETGLSHTVAVAWRALALLQTEIERGRTVEYPAPSPAVTHSGGKPWHQKSDGCECRRCDPKPRTKRRPRVYIAGPISSGDLKHNVEQATKAFRELVEIGAAPWCPQWSVYSGGGGYDGKAWPRRDGTLGGMPGETPWAWAAADGCGFSHRQWLDVDLAWVEVADAVLRLPGESKGADEEVDLADARGIPVAYSVAEIDFWMKSHVIPSPW